MVAEENSRTVMLIGEQSFKRLQAAHIAVIGLGGVGSYAVEALARAGVGELTLIDGDSICTSNINRQLFALHSTVGMKKTDVAKQRVSDINPNCKIHITDCFVNKENISELLQDRYTYCCDAIDDTDAKTAIALYCAQQNVPLIAAMGTGKKNDATAFRIADINQTEYCPLCKAMRKKYRDNGVSNIKVLFSKQQPISCFDATLNTERNHVPSSISFVPSVAGLQIAGHIINTIIDGTTTEQIPKMK